MDYSADETAEGAKLRRARRREAKKARKQGSKCGDGQTAAAAGGARQFNSSNVAKHFRMMLSPNSGDSQ